MARAALALPLFFIAACEFEADKSAMPIEMNTCTTSAACESGSACRDSLCVADKAKTPLKIALQVTPLQTFDGDAPLPILIEPFSVDKPTERQIDMKETVQITGQVRDLSTPEGTPVDATVTFTPVDVRVGLPARPVMATVTPASVASEDDYVVQLVKDVEYRMDVEPTEMRLPPYIHTFTAGDFSRRDVYFDEPGTREQALSISGEAADHELLVTAFDEKTGEPISSTAVVTKGKASLVFAANTDAMPFWIQIRAAQSYEAEPSMNAMQCDGDTPLFPSFAVGMEGIDMLTDPSNWKIALPKLPERIRYEGTVELCPEEQSHVDTITALPVTLRSRSVLRDGIRASFDATTNATYDNQAKALRFCVQVMEGDYDIVATPPASMSCALFAERITIKAPKGQEAATGALLSLPTTAYLAGKVLTTAAMPLASASVEARALGSITAALGDVELPSDDRSITRYNRSSDAVTDQAGSFKLPVDLGTYDLVAKPLAESGFPWQVRADVGVGVGARKATLWDDFDMASPVVVTGSLRYPRRGESAQATLGGAEVEAFALIDNGDSGEQRAVPVGKAMADADGRFMLLLPSEIKRGWGDSQ